jgi:hypothetical protein
MMALQRSDSLPEFLNHSLARLQVLYSYQNKVFALFENRSVMFRDNSTSIREKFLGDDRLIEMTTGFSSDAEMVSSQDSIA